MCIVNDFRIKSAHNARDCNRRVVVANHEGILVNMPFNAVKGLELERSVESLDSDFFNLS